jgi:hypothetical protein
MRRDETSRTVLIGPADRTDMAVADHRHDRGDLLRRREIVNDLDLLDFPWSLHFPL